MLTERSRRKRLKQFFLRLGIFFVFLCLIIFIIRILFVHKKTPPSKRIVHMSIVSPTSNPAPSEELTPTAQHVSSDGLQNAIATALTGTHGAYGIVVKNLKTGEDYFSHEHTQYASGSLYKLWVMATVFEQMKNGKLHKNDILSQTVTTLNKEFSIDPEDAEKTDGKITMKISDALYQMITISDNYAALLLTDKIKLASLDAFLHNNGFSESQVGKNGTVPMTTPSDIALFFEKLYTGQLANWQYTNEMLTLLKQQKLNNKIPEYLPDGTIIAHKTGELDPYTHDAGIIYAPNGDYILVILTESDSRPLAEERIANVSQAVYTYFNPATSP